MLSCPSTPPLVPAYANRPLGSMAIEEAPEPCDPRSVSTPLVELMAYARKAAVPATYRNFPEGWTVSDCAPDPLVEKGEPATATSAPVMPSMLYAEIFPEKTSAA